MWLIVAFIIGVILHGAFADEINSETFNGISALQGSMPDDIAPAVWQNVLKMPLARSTRSITYGPSSYIPDEPSSYIPYEPSITKREVVIITPSITKREVVATRRPMIHQPQKIKIIPTKYITKEELVIAPLSIAKRELGTTTKAMYIRPNALQMELETTTPYIIKRELETTTPYIIKRELETTTPYINKRELETTTPYIIKRELETPTPVMYIRPNPLKEVFLTTTPYIIDPKTDMSPLAVVKRVPVSPPQPPLNTTSSPLAVTTNQEFSTDLTDKPKKSRKYPKYRFNGKRRRKTTKQPSYTYTTMRSISTYLPESYIVKPPICVIEPISDMPLTGGHFHNYHIKS